jgi:tetratricopeptide (TPR) repeat protein
MSHHLNNQGNIEKAIENFDRAIEHNPNDSMAWNFRGIAYERSKKYPEALENFNKAIELFPEDSTAYFYRATVLRTLGKIIS